jgi:hypothetical protein
MGFWDAWLSTSSGSFCALGAYRLPWFSSCDFFLACYLDLLGGNLRLPQSRSFPALLKLKPKISTI